MTVPETMTTELSPAKQALLLRRLEGAAPGSRAPTIPRRPPGAPAPLSSAQRRMCFLEQLEPGSAAFNIPQVLRLRGPIDPERLRAAWNAVLARHEALRTTFTVSGDEQLQLVAPPEPVPVPVQDLSDLPPPRREAAARKLAQQDMRRPFDLATGPLWRIRLLRLAPEEHVLVLVLHHSITDERSTTVLMSDLATDYAGGEIREPAVQYGDVALWQAGRLTAARVERHLSYWREALAGAPALLDLPTDRPRPAVQSPAGGLAFRRAPAGLAARLDALAVAEGATPFMTLLAAYAVLLARYAGQDDLTVGVPIAGRDAPELERVVGCLLNTLVLRLRLGGGLVRGRSPASQTGPNSHSECDGLGREPTFRELLRRTRRAVLDAFGHAELPFEQLVDDLRPERSLAYSPLFQAMFNLIEAAEGGVSLPGVRVEPLNGVTMDATKADLSLTVTRRAGGLAILLSYRRDLFTPETATDLLDRYLDLLAAAAADPDRSWRDLPIGQDLAPVPPGEPATSVATVVGQVAEQAAARPEATALVCGDETVSYGELNRRANRLAHTLCARGVGPGTLVGIAVDRSVEMAVAVLGVLKAGGAYLALDLSHPPARLASILQRAAPALVLATGETELPAPAPPRLDPTRTTGPDHDPEPLAGPDDLAYVVFTSGSTGVPKGVRAHRRGVSNYLAFLTRQYRLGPADTVLQIAGLGFDASVRDLLGPLTAGARVVLLAPEQAKEPAAMLELIGRHRVTCLLSVVPTLLRAMVTVGADPAESLRLVLCSGERLYQRDVADAVALFGAQVQVVNQYGPTECTMTSTFHVATAATGALPGEPVPAGRPIPGASVYVLDHRGRPVPPGMPGEVYIGGAGVAGGYLGDPEQTRQRFRPDPFAGRPRAMMYRTGDRGRLRRDGILIFLGRLDDQVKIRGIRVEPGEVEAALRGAPGVRQAAAVVRADRPGGAERLVGYVAGGEPEAVRDWLRQRLPDHLVPAVVVALDALPVTPNGKMDRNSLPAPPAAAPGRVGYVAPRTPAEQRVAAAFAGVLGLERIGAEHNFFDAGGDSFAAVKVTRLLGDGMRVLDLFRYPTVAELATALDRRSGPEGEPERLLVALNQPRTPVVSLICVPYAGGSPVSFQPLAAALPDGHAVYGLALPGHDVGGPEEDRRPLGEVARAAADEILSTVDGPVAVYGHCSGAALAVELTRLLEAAGRRVEHLYLAAGFPNTRLPGRLFGRLTLDRFTSDRRFQTFFRTMGGFGDELTQDEIRLIVKNLRHDSRAAEAYFTRTLDDPAGHRLAAPITCIVGDRDPLTRYYNERVREWEAYSDRVSLTVLDRAGHYFLRHRADAVAAVITGAAEPEQVEQAPTDPPSNPPASRGFAVFAAVATTQFGTLVGSGMTGFALGVWVFQRTGSTTLLGLISLCAMLPGLLVSPLVGAVVDRVDRRQVMLGADLALMVSGVSLAGLLWTGSLRPWHLFVLASWFSVCNGFVRVAYTAAVPQLIPKRYLGRANGLALSGPAIAQVLAPLIAGALVVAIGLHWIIVVDLATFGVATLTLLVLRFPNRLPWRRLEPVLVEIAGGWRYLLSQRGLVALLTHAAMCNLLLAMAGVLVIPLVLRSTGSPGTLGLVMAAGGTGAALGGLVMAIWGGPARLMHGLLGFAIATGACIALLGAGRTTVVMAAGMLGYWLCLGISNACYTVLIQVKVPHHLHGRIFAMNQVVAFSIMPVGFVLAGPLADRVLEPMMAADGALAGSLGRVLGTGPGRGVALLMVLVGVLAALVNATGYLRPRLRGFEREIPDADPDRAIATGAVP